MSEQPTLIALFITLLLTFMVTIIEVVHLSKSSVKATLNTKYFIYAALQFVGNLVATIFAGAMIVENLPPKAVGWAPLIVAFAAVFAFEGILSNTNINIFDKKVLTIQEWLYRAKGPAVDRAIAKDLQYAEDEKVKIATELTKHCPVQKLSTYLLHPLPLDVQKTIKARASKSGDEHMYLALELVSRNSNKAKALLKSHKVK